MIQDNDLIHTFGHWWLVTVPVAIFIWLLATRLIENVDFVAKALGPLGRGVVTSFHKRQERYHAQLALETKMRIPLGAIPDDYRMVRESLQAAVVRMEDLEVEHAAMLSFISLDQQWYVDYRAALDAGATPPDRMEWAEFLGRWRSGWRPRDLVPRNEPRG